MMARLLDALSRLLNLSDFWTGVISSLVAAVIIYIFGRFLVRSLAAWSSIAFFLQVANRLRRGGVKNVFLSRQEYVTSRRQGSIPEYILTASNSLAYVGLWLSHATENARIDNAVKSLLERGASVNFVILDHTISEEHCAIVERFFSYPPETVREKLRTSWQHWVAFRDGLRGGTRDRFVLKVHKELLTYSCFIFDEGQRQEKILVDFKFYGLGRDDSVGIEVVRAPTVNGLSARLLSSFARIQDIAVPA